MSVENVKAGKPVALGLEAASNLAKTLQVDGNTIKPCVALIYESSIQKGDFVDRSRAANILASELKTLGKDEEYTFNLLSRWNDKNEPPIRLSELNSTVRTAYSHEYNYSCKSEFLKAFCIDPTMCPYHRKQMVMDEKYTDNRLYFKYRWPKVLKNAENLVYFLALIEFERKQGVGAGGIIRANHRTIAEKAGIEAKYVGKVLIRLEEVGLISYIPGTPRKWEGKASEVRRIIPIPKPSKELLSKLDK